MTEVIHGTVLPEDAATGKGNHSIEGLTQVTDEAARALIVQASTDRGRVVRQTAGTDPGLYAMDGAGGYDFVSDRLPSIDPIAWASAVWDDADIVEIATTLSSWPDRSSTYTFLASGAAVATVGPRITTTGAYAANGSDFGEADAAVLTTTAFLDAAAVPSIAAAADVYVAWWGWLSVPTDATYRVIVGDGAGWLLCFNNTRFNVVVRNAGGSYVTVVDAGHVAVDVASRLAPMWEFFYRPTTGRIELWLNGTPHFVSVDGAVTRFAATSLLTFGRNAIGAPSVSSGGRIQLSRAVYSAAVPTRAQRRGLYNYWRRLAA